MDKRSKLQHLNVDDLSDRDINSLLTVPNILVFIFVVIVFVRTYLLSGRFLGR